MSGVCVRVILCKGSPLVQSYFAKLVFWVYSSYLSLKHFLLQAVSSGHTIVVYEVCLSLRRMVQKHSAQLHLLEWELVYDTVVAIQQHMVQLAQVRSSIR